jgi:Pentapeptide repeats (8 copies)
LGRVSPSAGLVFAKASVRVALSLLGAVAVAAGVVALGYLTIHLVPEWLESTGNLTSAQVAERGRVTTASLAFLAGLVAAAGALFTGLTFRLSRRGQGTDRFTKAIELLAHKDTNARVGGIYALGLLAGEDPHRHHGAVLEVLVSFIRDQSPWPPPTRSARRAALASPTAALDVQAAMAVLARRNTTYDPDPLVIDLSNTNLRGVRAPRICLRSADLSETQLNGADLSGADLYDANLVAANLTRTILEDAKLGEASMQTARLVGTIFRGVKDLSTAKLAGATYDMLATDWPDGFNPPKDLRIE